MNMRLLVLWLTALLLPLRVPAPIVPNCADCDISDMALVTAGTHVQAGGVALGYLICQVQGGLPAAAGPDPTFAVYRKDGLPTDPSTYVRVGILQSVTDPATVTALLQRSWTLRPDLSPTAQEGSLSGKLDQMFGSLSNGVSGQPLAIKLANVISAARSDAAYRGQLQLLGKTFPGVNLCLGQGWAGSIPAGNRSTFEIRLRDPATGGDLAVVGRVTLDPTAPPVALPAPGSPVDAGVDVSSVALPATAFSTFRTNGVNNAKSIAAFGQQVVQLQSQRVNRAVRIRWSSPDPLRQRSVLQNGYNLWRLPAAAAPAAWIGGATGPTLAALQAAGATRVNELPIGTPEDLTAAQAADPDLHKQQALAPGLSPLSHQPSPPAAHRPVGPGRDAVITIDNRRYHYASLPEDVRQLVLNLQAADRVIAQRRELHRLLLVSRRSLTAQLRQGLQKWASLPPEAS